MTTPCLLVCLLLLAAANTHLTAHELIKFTVSSYILPDKKLSMELDVVTPRTPASYPTILYMTGLSGLLPSFFQSNLIDSVAEQGYIYMTVSPSPLRSPNWKAPTPTKSQMLWGLWLLGSARTCRWCSTVVRRG